MKCPNCGAEVEGSACPYCNSNLADLIAANKKARSVDRDDDAEDEDDEDDEITDEMIDEIRKLCRDFQAKYPDEFSCYEKDGDDDKLVKGKGVKDALFDTLDIDEDDEILLIHDDTIFNSGKSGFAITDYALYCKADGEDLEVTDLEDLDEDDEIAFDGGEIYLEDDETDIAYFTGDEKVKEDLCELYESILDVLYGDEEE